MKFELLELEIKNLSGFTNARIGLNGDKFLIGPNNCGKTSLLRIFDWIFNDLDSTLLEGNRDLNEDEIRILKPKRQIHNSAMRLTLKVEIFDGRTARKYCNDGEHTAQLRIQFRANNTVRAKLTPPSRSEVWESDSSAIELLDRIKTEYEVLFIDAARDARSEFFQKSLSAALSTHFSSILTISRGKKTGLVKIVDDFVTSIGGKASKEAETRLEQVISDSMVHHLPYSKIGFDVDINHDNVKEFVLDHLHPKMSIGEYDESNADIDLVGSGTQSLISFALEQANKVSKSKRLIVLIDEPESFLHPSAQTQLALQLFKRDFTDRASFIITSHSPYILAEADPKNIIHLRNHVVYATIEHKEAADESKDRYLLSTRAAGTFFDRSVLLVEGAGDVAFFESLRRRVAQLEKIRPEYFNALTRMRVQDVGGNSHFGPWLRLYKRYQASDHSIPIRYLVAADSIDSAQKLKEIQKGLELDSASLSDPQTAIEEARRTNERLASSASQVFLTPVDLEYTITCGLSDRRASEFARRNGLNKVNTVSDLAKQLGSKAGDGRAREQAKKYPYLRHALAEFLNWDEMSPDIVLLFVRWLNNALEKNEERINFDSESTIKTLLEKQR